MPPTLQAVKNKERHTHSNHDQKKNYYIARMKNLHFRRLAFLGLISALLSGIPAKAQEGNATTNTPPSVKANIQKTLTFEEALNWLKNKCAAENAIFRRGKDKHALLETKLTITECTHGHTIIQSYNNNEDEHSQYQYKLIFELSDMDHASVEKNADGYLVMVYAKTGKHITYIGLDGNDNDPKMESISIDPTSCFDSTDKSAAERVAKAFNHLFELAPKDDLFK